MNEKPFKAVAKSEQSASSFLKKLCWENYRRFCVRCRSYQFYRIAGKNYRCKRCGYTFHDFSGRWINRCRISSWNWVKIINLFEQECSARHISDKVSLSYPTALKAVETLRLSIIANSTDSGNWLDSVDFRHGKSLEGRQDPEMISVFGVMEQQGKVKIDILKGFTVKAILNLKPKMLRRSNIYYTDEYPPYEALVFHDFADALVIIDGGDAEREYKFNGESDFWPFAKRQIAKHRGISKKKFPQYLKELEFRYNHRGQPLFYILCQYVVSFVPIVS